MQELPNRHKETDSAHFHRSRPLAVHDGEWLVVCLASLAPGPQTLAHCKLWTMVGGIVSLGPGWLTHSATLAAAAVAAAAAAAAVVAAVSGQLHTILSELSGAGGTPLPSHHPQLLCPWPALQPLRAVADFWMLVPSGGLPSPISLPWRFWYHPSAEDQESAAERARQLGQYSRSARPPPQRSVGPIASPLSTSNAA